MPAQTCKICTMKNDDNTEENTMPEEAKLAYITEEFQELCTKFACSLMSDPDKLLKMQKEYWDNCMDIWQQTANNFIGKTANDDESPSGTCYTPNKQDRRFKSESWQENALFYFIKQSYLMTSEWLEKLVDSADDLDEKTLKKIRFYTRQFSDAMSPANFAITNPDVIKETIRTNGENLRNGMKNFISDMKRGNGQLKISTTDFSSFEIGHNIATTPGKVIYENEIMQLIQYDAQTKMVNKTPILIVPPWINKFYILDLQEKNSFVKWLVEHGHTVFIMSWVNPNAKMANVRFEDYAIQGVVKALEIVKQSTGERETNTIGYCLGGTLLAATMAYLAKKKEANRIKSATLLTTMLDFENSGELKLFMDNKQLSVFDKEMEKNGILKGSYMQRAFSMLRSNDMIWSFVINNYLMGKTPFPFDLLYWNEDSTNMPAALHSFCLKKLYRDNLLTVPNAIKINNTPIDIGKIKTPLYMLSTRDDHIAPWKATYQTAKMTNGKNRFVLSSSGHIAGVINPPHKNKYCYWVNEKTPKSPEDWLDNAKENAGSWWNDWNEWIKKYSGTKVKARPPGGGKLKPIENAPGSYVKVKCE